MTWGDEYRLHCDYGPCEHVSPAQPRDKAVIMHPWVQLVEYGRVKHFCHEAHREAYLAAQQVKQEAA